MFAKRPGPQWRRRLNEVGHSDPDFRDHWTKREHEFNISGKKAGSNGIQNLTVKPLYWRFAKS